MDRRASGGVHIAYHHLTSKVLTYLVWGHTNRLLSASSVSPTGPQGSHLIGHSAS